MNSPSQIRTKAAELVARFQKAGASLLETPVLQPAETLLDLYGEDIRARAYITRDALRGEQMLRPDFTVPVVQMHMNHGAEPARYTYAGEVFRRQEDHLDRASEYFQVGYEVFKRSNPADADAEVFALISQQLAGLPVRAATGDIGILMAAVEALPTSDRRKGALRRHIWHPRRFRALLDRFSGKADPHPTRKALLAGEPLGDAPEVGLRGVGEIAERIDWLKADARTAPLSETQVGLIDAILKVRETCPHALERLQDIAIDLPEIAPAVDRLAARLQALEDRGIDVANLEFEGSYGRTSMEYYDGFVFGFYAERRDDLPPIATGGRYDALTRRLGNGAEIPAVGGVIRPDIMIALGDRR